MLFVILFPIADSRNFLSVDTGLLHRPFWPVPIPDQDFVRSFGMIRRRWRGGLTGWVGENEVCEANKALRFERLTSYLEPDSVIRIRFRIAYRRFYFDGQAVGKFEVGVVASNLWQYDPSEYEAKELLYRFLELPVAIPNPRNELTRCPLVQAGRHLAELYSLGSCRTSYASERKLPKWWVRACPPLLLIEQEAREQQVDFPFWGKPVPLSSELHADIFHHIVRYNGLDLRLWRICDKRFDSGRKKLRQLRIYLLRLYAEQECLKQVLANVAAERVSVSPRTESSELLQGYINSATRRIFKLQSRSLNLSEAQVEEIARTAVDFVVPGERDAILAALRRIDIRRNIYHKVERFVNQGLVEDIADAKRDFQTRKLASLRRQLDEEQESLLLIQERKSQHVMDTAIPLELIRQERLTQSRIVELTERIRELEHLVSSN